MYLLISIVHVIVCLVLILVILLQAGKGGGLSEMFGGAMTQNQKLFGTETNAFLTKATSYSAIIFIVTCILLGVLTANEGRSLVSERRIRPVLNEQSIPAGTPVTDVVNAAADAAAQAPAAAAQAVEAAVTPAPAAPAAAQPVQETAPAAAAQ